MEKDSQSNSEEEIAKQELQQAYLDANKNEGQLEAMKDWEGVVGDGLDNVSCGPFSPR